MKIVKPMTLGLMHRPYLWQGSHRLLVATVGFFALGGRDGPLLRDNLQWRKVAAQLPHGRPLDELMPKTRGEVLLAGSAYAANGMATTEQTVRLQLGPVDKRLRVFGDRQWSYGLLPFFKVTAPAPFERMPLDWSRAYGGPGHPGNPTGRGYVPNPLAAFLGRNQAPMPNIEFPADPVRGHLRRHVPAGFGALDVGWMPRRRGIGTYGPRWQAESFPGLADDTDPAFFNAAPEDQRIAGHFQGGEPYRLEGLHPEHPLIEGRLPTYRPRAFVCRKGRPCDAVDEVTLAWDTVWFFPDVQLGVAIHRGEVPVTDSLALDIQALMVAYEHPLDTPRTPGYYGDVLALRTNRDTAARHVFNEAQLTPAPDAATRAARALEEQAECDAADAARQHREATLTAEFVAAGGVPGAAIVPPADAPEPLAIPSTASMKRGDVDLGPLIDSATRIGEQARALGEARRQQAAEALAAQAPAVSPVADTVERALARAAGRSPGLADLIEQAGNDASLAVDVAQLQDMQRQARLAAPSATAPVGPLPPAVAEAIGAWTLARVRDGGSLHGCDLAGADLRGAALSGADLRGALLEASDLSGARLDGADLREVALTGARLDDADCTQARFDGANLAGSRAHRSSFRGASFTKVQASEADWRGADLAGARFEEWIAPNIVLEGACLDDTTLVGCVLLHAKATDSRWKRSTWQRSVALGANLVGSDWTEARLTRSVLMACALADSRWSGASLFRVQAGGANWSRADLGKASADHSSWRDADLRLADLGDGSFRECDFSGARLDEATLERGLFYRSLFMGSVLHGCRAGSADFYQAVCRRGDFTDADLYGANFVQADCAEATFERALLDDVRIEPGRRLAP
ncbi:DUF2169 domain-containing protein [Xanthomonas sp. NCPPB 2632]|uniref:DUF2169 domain-containing protein n=1 Tax=Xanthomonas sp. NCPPB 2632 TaxID=3240912 RepID=UPI003516F7C3